MNVLAGYLMRELIYEGARTLVYRGVDRQSSQSVILKKLRKEYPTFNEILQFRNQYLLTKHLNFSGIVKPLALEKDGNSYVLVMEDVGGISLSQSYRESSLSPEEFFPVAIALTKVLENLHKHRIIHKDIKPDNILINPQTLETFIIDFSIASLLPRETQTLQSVGQLEGTLAYISPEQTGRMNRGIDYRSDFYSLGVTFYQLLTGQLPFLTDDAMELVHSHIAKMPAALGTRAEAKGKRGAVEEIPEVLSDIVLKLMAKTPEERYQSAKGLERDLTECWQQWQKTGKVSHFELGQKDRSDRFGVPEKLYGRETEVRTLLKAYERVAAGATEMMLVAGFSGIGKTAAVNEVRKPIIKHRGYFIKGKFDQFQRNIPNLAIAQALRDWVEQLLGESEARLAVWREQILGALGEQGRVILEVIPELEKIVGPQPTVAELSGNAAANRFNLLFGKFMGAIATKEHPLVMFLDDLQWADATSLKLMETLMGEGEDRCLFLVGAYRDNEVEPAHPLMLTLDQIIKSGAKVNTIALEPLSKTEIDALISDTLRCDRDTPLTELVYATAKGNPFFTNQLLKSLYEDGAIYFNFDTYMWQWDGNKIRGLSLADDVVEFMASRISKLPAPTLEVLELAACIGNRFDLATLAIVSEKSQTEVAARLWPALQEGLVLPLDENYKFYQDEAKGKRQEAIGGEISSHSPFPKYKFMHDRVQQAAYFLIPENRLPAIHLKIGKRLFQELDEGELSEKIFDVVNRFNLGQKSFEDESEKERLAELNFQAGAKAKSSTAYAAAVRYFTICTELLGEEGWQQRYDLTFSAHKELAASQFLIGNFEVSLMLIELTRERAQNLLNLAEISSLKIVQLTMESRYSEAIEAGLDALAMLGINLREEEDLQLAIQREMAAIEQQLNGREVAELLELPEMTVPEIKAIVKLLIDLDPPTYITSQLNLYGFVSVKAARLSIEYGNCQESVKAYANYGLILGYLQGKYQLGYQFASLALKLSDKLKTATQKCRASLLMGGWIYVWSQPIKGAAEINLEGFKSGLEAGEIQFAGYNVLGRISNLMFQGSQVQSLREEIEKYWSFADKSQNQLLVETLTGMKQFVIALEHTPSMLPGFGESEFIARCRSSQSFLGLCLYDIFKMQLCCIYGNFNEGLKYAEAAKDILASIQGFTTFAKYGYYASLILLNVEVEVSEKEARIKEVKAHQKQLQAWAESCPENFSCMYFLVAAEIHRREQQKLEAIECYDRAISAAKENGFIHQEALANEFAAKFYLDWGKEKLARTYLVDAYYAYADWGAVGKLKDLEERYPLLLAGILAPQTTPVASKITIVSTIASPSSANGNSVSTLLDWTAAIKSSQVISQVLALEELLSKLMETLMQNAGASKGVLLLPKGDSLVIEAIANYPEESAQTIEVTAAGRSVPLESNEQLPLAIVNTVWRARETIVINDSGSETRFAADSYLIRQQPKSILCLPLLERGKLAGILYLENSSATGAFTSDRLELLKVLSSQAAISLENARLYQQSQDYAQQVEASLQQLQQAQLQLVQSEKMATIGELTAGIAHEINNPVAFIAGNLKPATEYVRDLTNLLNLYRETFPSPGEIIEAEIEEIDLDYLIEDLPKIIQSMKEATDRIAQISKSMRNFSRGDTAVKVSCNLHWGIDSTLLILKHRLKASAERPEIEVVKNYGNLPEINCYPGQLNQVFINLLSNAIDAFEEANRGRSFEEIEQTPNRIVIATEIGEAKQQVIIKIADNARGISEEVKSKIFDHLFTTKEVGKGTGLGLSISRQIIEEKHHGQITCTSEEGKGTEFAIALPM